MATTRIWKVGSNLSRVVDYAKDETKTENPAWNKTDYQTMRDVMDYAMDDAKKEKQFYVTALNCNADYAREQMQMTKRRYDKTDGILAWHGYQSFAEGEVDADTAHKIGVALAKELWPDFEVIVATHLNTHCFHNHFVLNSVSFLHGRKFNACKESYKKCVQPPTGCAGNMACRSLRNIKRIIPSTMRNGRQNKTDSAHGAAPFART